MKFQIGKAGVTPGVLQSLSHAFKTHKSIRISVLRNYAPTKDKVREIAETLTKGLQGTYRYTLIGFTVVLNKQKDKAPLTKLKKNIAK